MDADVFFVDEGSQIHKHLMEAFDRKWEILQGFTNLMEENISYLGVIGGKHYLEFKKKSSNKIQDVF